MFISNYSPCVHVNSKFTHKFSNIFPYNTTQSKTDSLAGQTLFLNALTRAQGEKGSGP